MFDPSEKACKENGQSLHYITQQLLHCLMLTAGRDVSKEDMVKQRGHIILYSTLAQEQHPHLVRVLLLFYDT